MENPIIRDGALVIGERKYLSSAFGPMLTAFGVRELNIDSAETQPDEEAGNNFAIIGFAQILSQPIAVKLYLDFVDGDAFEFQLSATLPTLSLSILHDREILPKSYFADRLLPHSFPEVKLIFDSEMMELYFARLSRTSASKFSRDYLSTI